MERYLLPLDQIGAEHQYLVGGKAFHLGELRRAGVRVPAGFCITTAAYSLFLQETGIDFKAVSSLDWESMELQRAPWGKEMVKHPLPDRLYGAIEEAYRGLGEKKPVAVRSSATREDLPEASFAGQYETYLNVLGLEELVEKIRACWASLWNLRALSYLHRHHISPLEVAMGVMVQEQIPAEVSGVLFTLNPSTGLEEEMLIEAHWGLGEAVVSGKVTPDRFVVDAWNEQIRSREISEKRMMVVPAHPSGVREVEVPEEKRTQASLTEEQLLPLMRLGYEVQEVYGYPQDIEWALYEGEFYVLQTRPLTSYTFTPEIGQWTSANFREVMPGFITPLSFSINGQYEWGRALEEVFQRLKMTRKRKEIEWGRLFFGRAYWNVGEVKRLNSIIPGFKERDFDASMGLEPTYEGDGLVTPTTPITVIRALPVLFALQNLYKTFWQEAKEYKEAFAQEEAKHSEIDLTALDDAQLAEKVKDILEFHHRTNRIALIVGCLAKQAQDDFTPMVEGLNARNPDAEPISMARLLTGLTDVATGRPLLELWKVSQEALKDARVKEIILEAEPSELPERLQASPEGQAFWSLLERYIREFRYMSEKDEDMSLPRWDEDPTFAFTTLKSFLQAGGDTDPEKLIAQQKEIRLQEERRAARLLSQGWLDRLFRKQRFFSALETLKRYSWWREETRPMLSLAHYHGHRVFVEQGKRWAASGYLEEPGDIFLLTRNHLLAALEGNLSSEEARTWIHKYKRLKACYRNFEPPLTIGRGARAPEIPTKAAVYKGVSCSAGRATGKAKVVRELGEADKLKNGDILVAPYTNPGWTPLFNLAAGIVTEEGGLISHGAIVAREYGIPTVLQIREATKIFQDGQTLCVDGDRGVVEVLE